MIFPERVFGRLSPKRMSFSALAIGPISPTDPVLQFALTSFFASSPVGVGPP